MGYSTQSKGYKIRDLEFSKLIVCRDVTSDETSVDRLTAEMLINNENTINVDVPGGDINEEINDNIDLYLKSDEEKERAFDSNSNIEFEDAYNSPEKSPSDLAAEFGNAQNSPEKSLSGPEKTQPNPQLKRSKHQRKPTGECRKVSGMLASALGLQEVPTSYKVATSPDNTENTTA